MPYIAPKYDNLCAEFGFRVPKLYHDFLRFAEEILPDKSRDAFDALAVCYLDERGPNAVSYTAPPEFFCFAWTGTDSGSYGFVVDQLNNTEDYPITEWYPDGCHRGIIATSFQEFLGFLLRPEDDHVLAEPEPPIPAVVRLRRLLGEKFALLTPRSKMFASRAAWQQRLRSGAVATEDLVGALVPPETVDSTYLASIKWPSTSDYRNRPPFGAHLIEEAGARLTRGEVGTALVLARNTRFHYWYDDWKADRMIIRRTCDIMARAYEQLGRSFAAQRIRKQTASALEQVS